MKVSVVLAVLGVCSALPHQAYNSFPSQSYGVPHGGYYQPKWTGPLASSVPAGIGGKVIPLSDTYEVAAAKDAFFQAYHRQLASVARYGQSYHGAPVSHGHSGYHGGSFLGAGHGGLHGHGGSFLGGGHGGVHAHGGSYGHGVGYGHGGAPIYNGEVQDTPAVAAAKSQFYQLYNKQAAAAAAAPDIDAYGHHGHQKAHHY
ncbi:cuticle protein 5-like [Palaemon carinicauda]|uniref:cuticle protein 5-like n=1 Tax=Palaemon carinicauda TaxID=392227 RepID=UPI0035B652F8